MKSIIGRKIGMTSVFAEDGTQYPVSVIEVLPNVVLQKKTAEKDGYEAILVGYEPKKKNITKAMQGIFDKAKVEPQAYTFELKGDEDYKFEVGQSLTASLFEAGDNVDVTGTSKGRGYSGVIKRWHKHIGPKGHGSGYHRQIGSLATNGRCNNRVHPGKPMSGHHGNYTRTTLNLTVVAVYPEKNAILIKGSVPGPDKSIVKIRTAVKAPALKHEVKKILVREQPAAAPAEEKKPAAEEAK